MVGMLFKGAACRHKPAHSEGPAGTPAVPVLSLRGAALYKEHGVSMEQERLQDLLD